MAVRRAGGNPAGSATEGLIVNSEILRGRLGVAILGPCRASQSLLLQLRPSSQSPAMRLPGEAGGGTAAMLMRVVTPTITDITAITHITGIKGITGTGITGTADTARMPAATRRRSLTGTGTSPQGLGAGSQAIIRASGCARRREQRPCSPYRMD